MELPAVLLKSTGIAASSAAEQHIALSPIGLSDD